MADRVSIPATALRPYRHAIVGRRPDGEVLAIQVVHIRRHGDRLLCGLDDHTAVSIGVDENITVEDWSDHLSPGARALADAWVPDDASEEAHDSGLGSLLIIVGDACAALGVAGPAELPEAIAKLTAERDRLAQILNVERGVEAQAPEAWEPRGADMWVCGRRPGRPVIQRYHRDGAPTTWIRRGTHDRREWPTALAAMEAWDAEVSGG